MDAITGGMVRLYRMQPRGGGMRAHVAEWIACSDAYRNMIEASGRWFAESLEEAAWYAREHPDGEIVYVDLPRQEAETFRVSAIAARDGPRARDTPESPAAWSARPDCEFFLSREAALRARPLAHMPRPEDTADADVSPPLFP